MKILLFLSMLFLHIVDDYYLQGILAQMKQKSWWEKNAPDELYKNDYKIALLEHAFSWTFMIMLPIALFMMYSREYFVVPYSICFVINWVIHAIVDDLKANKKIISLVIDQSCHIIQIAFTWGVLICWLGK